MNSRFTTDIFLPLFNTRLNHTVLQLLFELNEKYPGNSKIISRLGKTLSNQVICRNEEGQEFLMEAIEIFEREDNKKQLFGHIFFYLYNLLNDEKFERLNEEIKRFKNKIKHLPSYFLFLGEYYEQLDKPEEEIINLFEDSIRISSSDNEKRKSVYSLLNYLANKDGDRFRIRIEHLNETLIQLSPADNNG